MLATERESLSRNTLTELEVLIMDDNMRNRRTSSGDSVLLNLENAHYNLSRAIKSKIKHFIDWQTSDAKKLIASIE